MPDNSLSYSAKLFSYKSFKADAKSFIRKISKGSVFIYPTDTIYGLGCNALSYSAVERIRKIKKRPKQPFSVIAPSFSWILDNFELTPEALEWLKKLPGKYTFILKLKKGKKPVADNVSFSGKLGIRIPKHWSAELARLCSRPIITTSVNISGKPAMQSIDGLCKEIADAVDFIFYEGRLGSQPSKVFDLSSGKPLQLR